MGFAPEREVLQQIMERFNLNQLISQFEESGGLRSYRDLFLGTQLKISPLMSPRLFELLAEVREILQFEPEVDLFILADASINAGAVYSLDEGPHIVSLTSSMVERMDDEELRFVLGHEIGHIHFQHYRAKLAFRAVSRDKQGRSRLPVLLARRLGSWGRLAELSADRAGFAAAGGKLEPIVSAFFKMESRLGPEHLKFDITAFLQQLEELRQLDRRDLIYGFSHPITPIRVRALQLFRDAGGSSASAAALAQVDQQVTELTKLMEYEATKPLDVKTRDFVLAGGVMTAHVDGRAFSPEEYDMLVKWLLPVIPDPEAAISKITSYDQARKMLTESAAWLKENAGEERFVAYRMLVGIAAVDGDLSSKEEEFLYEVADLLDIPRKAAKKIVRQILSKYVKARQFTAPDMQEFSVPK
jgi:Zn-dependent protease with chaperone function